MNTLLYSAKLLTILYTKNYSKYYNRIFKNNQHIKDYGFLKINISEDSIDSCFFNMHKEIDSINDEFSTDAIMIDDSCLQKQGEIMALETNNKIYVFQIIKPIKNSRLLRTPIPSENIIK